MHRVRPLLCRAVSAVVAAAVPWFSACTDSSSSVDGRSAIHVDSAGVDIAIDSTRRSDVPTFTTVDSVPTLRLGALDGRPEEQFGTISDLLPLPDGGVAVLDAQAMAIRLFGPDGAYRNTVGSKGNGPGELQRPVALGLLGRDTVEVFDASATRITRFGLDGGLGGVTTVEAGARPTMMRGAFFSDGRLAGQSRWFVDRKGSFEMPTSGTYTSGLDSAIVAVYTPQGALTDTVALLPNNETVRLLEVGNQTMSIWLWPAAYGRSATFRPHPDGVWLGFSDRFELRLHDATDGHLVRVLRAPGLERPMTDEVTREIRDYAMAQKVQNPQGRRDVEKWLEASPRPETMPAYDDVVVDDEARLWVQDWSGTEPSGRWWVFSRLGDLLGSVDFPEPRTTLYAVRCGAAWVVTKDDLDVSHVARYVVHEPVGSDASECPVV